MRAKEIIPASKPRNFVAKNQKTGGAGAHRDKKKEQKQGYEKHKGKGVAESISVVDQDYDLDQVILTLDIEGKQASFTYTDYDENFENAERKDVFDQLQNNSWYKGLDHPTKMEILDAAYKAIRGEDPSEYKPTVDDEPLEGSMMEYETHRYKDDQGNEWEVNDEGERTLLRAAPGGGYGGGGRYGSRYPRRPTFNKPKGYYFFNVPPGKEQEAKDLGLMQTKSGKWYSLTSNQAAVRVFGQGRYWEPKN